MIVQLIGYLAWPAAIVYLAWRFEPQIKSALTTLPSLADRIRKVGPFDFAQQPTAEVAHEAKALIVQPLHKNPIVAPYEQELRRMIAHGKIDKQPDFIDRMIYVAADAIRSAQLEGVARLIFGSQFSALNYLEQHGPQAAPVLRTFYEQHALAAQELEAKPSTFEEWLAYLTSRFMLRINPDGLYEITLIGEDWLRFAQSIDLTPSAKLA